ncbi:MAG: hypothetical protein AAB574_03905 [Patescibacteria group bacterium]
MSTGLDHREFALVHAGHQMHQETAMVIAIDPTPGREGGDECWEQLQIRCLKCDCTSAPFSPPVLRVTVAPP